MYKANDEKNKINVSKLLIPPLFDGCVDDVFETDRAGLFSFSGSSNAYKHIVNYIP